MEKHRDALYDPRIQYPKAAKKQGIASILSVPISIQGQVTALRVYTAEPNKANHQNYECRFE